MNEVADTFKFIMLGIQALSLLASGVSVFFCLYVKAQIAPIVQQCKEHARLLDERREGEREQWSVLNRQGLAIAKLQAKANCKGD